MSVSPEIKVTSDPNKSNRVKRLLSSGSCDIDSKSPNLRITLPIKYQQFKCIDFWNQELYLDDEGIIVQKVGAKWRTESPLYKYTTLPSPVNRSGEEAREGRTFWSRLLSASQSYENNGGREAEESASHQFQGKLPVSVIMAAFLPNNEHEAQQNHHLKRRVAFTAVLWTGFFQTAVTYLTNYHHIV